MAESAEDLLIDFLYECYADPLRFVMGAFPWSTDSSLQLVKLLPPFRERFNCDFGPDIWSCEFLDELGALVKERGFDGTHSVNAIRMAVASGHGIGKSALTAWIVNWIMSTRPNAKGVVTANTSEQLSGRTWAEIVKWGRKSITAHWFDFATGKGSMKMRHKTHPESWVCAAFTCREENSEAFAGLHAADSTPFYLFDEASAIPQSICEVAEGGLTDGETPPRSWPHGAKPTNAPLNGTTSSPLPCGRCSPMARPTTTKVSKRSGVSTRTCKISPTVSPPPPRWTR